MTDREIEKLVLATGKLAAELRAEADRVRHQTVGDAVAVRGIIEFSNVCRCNCLYCGLRRDNKRLLRQRMAAEEIIETAKQAEEMGLGTVVLQSGEDESWTAEKLAEVISEIKRQTRLAVTLSVGEREEWEYRLWREAGADRYLLKHETADRELYQRLHPGASFDNRLACLETLAELGYQVGAGCIVGLPGQTAASLVADLRLMERLNVHMAGIGPLIPHPHTPLAHMPVGSVEIVLNMLALTRLLIPDVMLPATTALETAAPGAQVVALQSGANVIMPNITPRHHAVAYEIYPGRRGAKLPVEAEVDRAKRVVAAAGRTLDNGPGHSPRLSGCKVWSCATLALQ
ncbi:MAG: [FeFe] hydrogenase H-cluster radical SAM maturase HydE [Armatimonadetes bacterium]|nr:[FeFe] hydrogenase H-cluster radical SAM maturase HydE [Armatimonadota bacterium]